MPTFREISIERHAVQMARGERRSSVRVADEGNLYRGKSGRLFVFPLTACRSFPVLKGGRKRASIWTQSTENRSLRRTNSRSFYGVAARTPGTYSPGATSPPL